MVGKRLDDRDIIVVQKMYYISHKTIESIAKIYDLSVETIQYYVDKHPPVYKPVYRGSGSLKSSRKRRTRRGPKPRVGPMNKLMGKALSLYIRNNLNATGITPAQLADELSIGRQAVYNWLIGSIPIKENMEKIFEFFQTGHETIEDVFNDPLYFKE